MRRYVVDASVAIKWYLPEVHEAAATRLLEGSRVLLVPDLFFSEIGNILWKRMRVEELSFDEGANIFAALDNLPLVVHSSQSIVFLALEIAARTQRTFYDSVYLALAVKETALLVTADARLYNALKEDTLAPYLCWVEDIE